MKGTPLDYVLAVAVLGPVSVASIGVAELISVFLTRELLGPYFVFADFFVFLCTFGCLCAVGARLILRWWPLGGGLLSMEDRRFTIWKLYTVLYEFGCGALKPFTVMFLRPAIQSLFGAQIGRGTALGGKLVDPHLIRIEDFAIIGEGAVITAHAINSGSILLEPIIVGRGATVGVGAVVYPGVVIGENAVIAANAVIRSGTRIPEGEFWGGVPAVRLRNSEEVRTVADESPQEAPARTRN